MGILSQTYSDCGRLFSDFYENTPRVEYYRNHTPSFIYLRWGRELDPNKAVVEFFNYSSILPYQESRTFTTRGSYGIYPVTSPDMIIPLAPTIAVPPYAQRFRIRLLDSGPLVTNMVNVSNNQLYYYEAGMINTVYSF